MTKPRFYLFNDEEERLEEIEKKNSNWRVRQRAKTLLLLAYEKSVTKVAEILKLHPQTIRLTSQKWEKEKFGMLEDKPRCGAPKKLSEEERERLYQWAKEEPLSTKELLVKHIEAEGKPVHFNTIMNELKGREMVWKRTRHSLKKKRDEEAFCRAALALEVAKELVGQGEFRMAYVDEAGFSCVHPNRNAWTPKGEQHLVPAIKGKRLNVLAALISTGNVEHFSFEGSMKCEHFAGFLNILSKNYGDKPLMVVLDNASVHTAKKIQPEIEFLKSKGIHLYFLPPYSPELNRIEKLWHKMKNVWMGIKNRTTEALKEEVDHILYNVGYKFKFSF